MKRIILISALITASSILVTGCGGPSETVEVKNQQGEGKVSGNNGVNSEKKEQVRKDVPIDIATPDATDPAKAKAHAGSAYVVNGSAHAEKAAGAPAASKADAMSTVTSYSAFKLKRDGKKVTLTVDDHFTVTLKGDDAKATIHIEAKISGAGGTATLDKIYEFKPNVGDPINKIDISDAHTETIANGSGKGYQEKAAVATLSHGDYTMELKLTITTSGSVLAEAVVDKVEMTLPTN